MRRCWNSGARCRSAAGGADRGNAYRLDRRREGPNFTRRNGRHTAVLEGLFGAKWHRAQFGTNAKADGSWIGFLTDTFAQNENAQGFFVTAAKLRLRPEEEVTWRRCGHCTRAQP